MSGEVPILYGLVGVVLFVLGVRGLIARRVLVAKVLACNVMGAGVFLVLIALAARGEEVDPVPHAMVLTGIVVAVSATALALALVVKYRRETGEVKLPEGEGGDE
jgi:multicomponent Na+:H+ antiporter subunit C